MEDNLVLAEFMYSEPEAVTCQTKNVRAKKGTFVVLFHSEPFERNPTLKCSLK